MDWDTLIRTLLGKPFRWNARGPDAYDCWGLVAHVLDQLGRPYPRSDWFVNPEHPESDCVRMFFDQEQSGRWVKTDTLSPGNVVAMTPHRRVRHVGIQTPRGILHTTAEHGVMLTTPAMLRAVGYQRIEGYTWAG